MIIVAAPTKNAASPNPVTKRVATSQPNDSTRPYDAVLTATADVEPYLTDHRRLHHGATAAVVLPRTTDEVADVLHYCNGRGIGGGTAPVWGDVARLYLELCATLFPELTETQW